MPSQDEVVQAIEELIAAVEAARAEMRRAEQGLRRALQRIAAGEPIESLIVIRPPAEKRKAFLDALEEVHRTRHAMRRKVFAYSQQRGVSVAEMARSWGISRQLASRYLKEESASSEISEIDETLLSASTIVEPTEVVVLEGVAAVEDGDP